MRKILSIVIGLVIIGLIGYGIATKISKRSDKTKTRSTHVKAGSGIAIPVEIAPVKIKDIKNVHTFTGTLEPWSEYEVAPKIAGRLETLNVEIGDPVYNGQLIAKIDDAEYLQEIEKAKADLDISEAVKGELITQYNLAKREYERAVSMKKSRVISDASYEAKFSDYLVKAASLKKAEAELNQKQAILNLAKVRFNYTKIYARWAGKENLIFILETKKKSLAEIKKVINDMLAESEITKRYNLKNLELTQSAPSKFILELKLPQEIYNFAPLVSEFSELLKKVEKSLSPDMVIKLQDDSSVRYIGDKYVDAGQMLKANDPILSIINIRRMKAMVNVIEKDYPLLKSGQEAIITTGAYPDKHFKGKVRKITKILNEYTRQAEVEIEIDNPQLLLRPGMFAKVSIQFATFKNAQTVPRNALVNFNDIPGVFMLSRDRKTVNFFPVEAGLVYGDDIQIISPKLNRPVITLGNHLLYNGVAVNITSREKILEDALPSDKSSDKPSKPKTSEAK
jgi:multidrug efflux pump subunit AcrA (membrane-fusion protein)